MSDFVMAAWARTAVNSIEQAISEWNVRKISGQIHIAWGHANKEDENEERTFSTDYQHQHGLMNWRKMEFEILIPKCGDPSLPQLVSICTTLAESMALPLIPRDLYNVLHSLDGVNLATCVEPGSKTIFVTGVGIRLAVENLTGRVLHDALLRLYMSHGSVSRWLASRGGDDHWTMDGGE